MVLDELVALGALETGEALAVAADVLGANAARRNGLPSPEPPGQARRW